MGSIESVMLNGFKFHANFSGWKRSRSYTRTSDHYYDCTETEYHYEGACLISRSCGGEKYCFMFYTPRTRIEPKTLEACLMQFHDRMYNKRDVIELLSDRGKKTVGKHLADVFLQAMVDKVEASDQSIPLLSIEKMDYNHALLRVMGMKVVETNEKK